ncbi:GMC family oxidoreductase [Pontivivens insulae]|uniref:Alcohol dehydrogenase [acceptor] n=1 Tax=Pontivivens insulae TaxID=1639689 RepID=A0A2R8AFC2_9RHOB|nr:FAD-dependent oxidoreductase [Pontivivens insulae]RED12141.1 choline dehydrogenase-like flavoprotein [Pontivivens insulae]SPF30897.1 Alcohol dehydrogenase [acceptor] [Pontivivens insulae]
MADADLIIVGAGSAGCALAGRLAELGHKRILVLEAGPSDAHPLVRMPFGLVWLMGSGRDWSYRSTAQAHAAGRDISVPRGRMVGGSGSINSMVWFRGQRSDFDGWNVPGWDADAVWPSFEGVEAAVRPGPLPDPHRLTRDLAQIFPGQSVPVPEAESAGPFRVNMRRGRRWSAADAFLRPALRTGAVELRTGCEVDRLIFEEGRAVGVLLGDGRRVRAARGVVMACGSIGSPAILMRSGIGPAAHLHALGIEPLADRQEIGRNLHDHPAVPVFHEGAGSGYGLTVGQLPLWALAPLRWSLTGRGRFASNSVEGGMFFDASGQGGAPDCQVHFIPARLGHKGRAIGWGAGYYADVCLCRPKSRGVLQLKSPDWRTAPDIDLNLFSVDEDLEVLAQGLARLRSLLAQAPFGKRHAPEVFPGPALKGHDALREDIRARCGTAYHPVGTLRMGKESTAPVAPDLRLRGVEGVWVADASIMPNVTSANTNAPSMMIGWHGAALMT